MRKIITTVLLALLAALSVTAAIFLAVDGNLSRLTNWYHFRPGMPLFTKENMNRLEDVGWMRIRGLHDTDVIECARDSSGTWWITRPFHDRLDPHAIQSILSFTANARVVGTLPYNKNTRRNLREFGVETAPHTITLKVPEGEDGEMSTVARYTLGSTSPWLADAGDGKSVIPTTYLRTDFYGRDKRIHVVSGNIVDLFREGLEALRDPRPLLFEPDTLRSITITNKGEKPIVLTRASAEADWNIISPLIIAADQDKISNLVAQLGSLAAIRVEEPSDGCRKDGEEVTSTIELKIEGSDKPLRLTLYTPYISPADGQTVCHAEVDGRTAWFTLPAAPRVNRQGSYARIVNSIFSMPVLPARAMAQLKSHSGVAYTGDLPLQVEQLRSLRFTDIEARDVERVSLRSRYYTRPLRLVLVPGDADSDVSDTWMFSADGLPYQEAEGDVVRRFLSGLKDIPVTGIAEDLALSGGEAALMAKYGLDKPDYVLAIRPRSCAYRALLFGVDLPLVKDRGTRFFFISRYRDPQSGKRQWVGMERGGHTVSYLSTKLTRLFALEPEAWKLRNIVNFPISALRHLTFGFQQAPLELDYDYIGETWTGTLNGEDVTPRINPHRAEYFVRQLQKMKAAQWLDPADEDAVARLKTPVFSVQLKLEVPDYSEAEAVIMDHEDSQLAGLSEGSRFEQAAELLRESSETDEALRNLAMQEVKTHARTITLEIAPSGELSDTPFFYGRIRETGELFTLSFQDAQSLAGNILDM